MKHLVGKQVWLIPTGNNARGHGRQKHITRTVTSAAKVFATIGGSKMRFCERNGRTHLDQGSNSGYIVFESEADLNDYQDGNEIALKISHDYRYASDWEKLDIAVLRQVAALIGLPTSAADK